jgi:hypothetical protein
MILFQGGHLMGVLKCHQLTPPNKMVELKTNELCVKNWVEFIGAIRVSRCRFCVNFFPRQTYIYSHLCLSVLCFVFCAPTNDQTTVPFSFRVVIFSSFVIILQTVI